MMRQRQWQRRWQMPAKQASKQSKSWFVHVYNINTSIRYGNTIFESVPPIFAFSVPFFVCAPSVCAISYFCLFLHIKQSLLRIQSAMWIAEPFTKLTHTYTRKWPSFLLIGYDTLHVTMQTNSHLLTLPISHSLFRCSPFVKQPTNVSEWANRFARLFDNARSLTTEYECLSFFMALEKLFTFCAYTHTQVIVVKMQILIWWNVQKKVLNEH